MKLTTPVEVSANEISIQPTSKLTFVGSCFAQHIGEKAVRAGLDTHANPFGVLYNPLSITLAFDAMLGKMPLTDNLFFSSDGLWHCHLFDSSFSSADFEACRAHVARTLAEEAARLPYTDYLFLTFGTNRCYILRESRQPVGNCHKLPAALFEERQLGISEITETVGNTLQSLWAISPNLKVVFTVSPYRYAKYGFHQSRLGKAVLLLAADRICSAHPSRCFYFPAYEILLDELRDYRFYAPDLLHPSETAVNFMWERFADACLNDDAKRLAQQWSEIEKAAGHYPIHPNSKAQHQFFNRTINKLNLLTSQYPHLKSLPAYKQMLSKLKPQTLYNERPEQ